jgi:orotate phosphoribosyltransferase
MESALKVMSVFLDPVIWGGALLIAAVIGAVEWFRLAKIQGRPKLDLEWVAACGIVQSTHTLTHQGGISPYFLNLDRIASTTDDVEKLSGWYIQSIGSFASETEVDMLAFVEKDSGPVGTITLMGRIVTESGIPAVTARLRKRENFAKITGDPETVEGLRAGQRVLLVTDAITSGRTANDAIAAISDAGGKVVGVCTLLDRRGEKGKLSANIPVIYGTTEEELAEKGLIKRNANVPK